MNTHFLECGATPLGLYPVVDSVDWIKKLLPLGISTIQLRIKDKAADQLEKEIAKAVEVAEHYKARLFINDYWPLAIKYKAYGVHLGQEDLDSADLEKILKAGLRLGVSTHSLFEIDRILPIRPSYLAFGPIFPTSSKAMPFVPQGITKLAHWVDQLNYPVVAIGGINQERLAGILETGVSGIAMISAITQAADPLFAAKEMMDLVNEYQKTTLTKTETGRYAQHLKLPEIGISGQLKLKSARVLCIGAGGLASPLLLYLAAAGVGNLGIVDNDTLELTNLQRQILYKTEQVGLKKAELAELELKKLNPDINIQIYAERLSINNAADIMKDYDIVADCSDNFATRYLVNDMCFNLKKPFVSASVNQFEGQCSLFLGTEGPCYRCLFPTPPPSEFTPSCEEAGVLGVLPGILGTLQAGEILKWILQKGALLQARLLSFDLLQMKFKEFTYQKNSDCEICVSRKSAADLLVSESCFEGVNSISVSELKELLFQDSNVLLLDVRSREEHERANIGGLLISLNELPGRLNELDSERPIVVYCHSGKRSLTAAKTLLNANYARVKYLEGGMLAWNA